MMTLAGAAPPAAPGRYYALDADGNNVLLNRPGAVCLVLCTSESSQDMARAAGRAMYPFQGLPDFQIVVVADLRDSIAGWVPNIVLQRMRSSLDREAVEIKPFFLRNGNPNDPRKSLHAAPDFQGTICPQLGWIETSDHLRGILFGADGREIRRWEKIDNMGSLQAKVRDALRSHAEAEKKAAQKKT